MLIGHNIAGAHLPRPPVRVQSTDCRHRHEGNTMTSTFELAFLDIFQFLIDNSETLTGLIG